MITLVTGFVLITTIVLAVAIGVGTGFLMISAILNAFARKPEPVKANSAPALVTQGVTGD